MAHTPILAQEDFRSAKSQPVMPCYARCRHPGLVSEDDPHAGWASRQTDPKYAEFSQSGSEERASSPYPGREGTVKEDMAGDDSKIAV